jgi:pSer/pThr/pTyr-binding forkhead associated (FHA) protein
MAWRKVMDDSVNTADVVVVNSSNGDWQGVYLNGELIDQDHRIYTDELLQYLCKEHILVISVQTSTVPSSWLNKTGWLPQLLENCVFC